MNSVSWRKAGEELTIHGIEFRYFSAGDISPFPGKGHCDVLWERGSNLD